MLGIIATIVAAVKRRYTFAAIVGGWTFLAFILAINGVTVFAFSPGFLFLIIAICMQKNPPKTDGEEIVLSAELSVPDDPEKKFVCMSCGTYSPGWYQTCPVCGAVGRIKNTKDVTASDNAEGNDSLVIYFCRSCGYVGNDSAGKTDSCPKCREPLLETGMKRAQWLSLTDAEKEAAKINWQNGVLIETSEQPETTEPEQTATVAEIPKFCRICGKSLASANHFCPYCGAEILMPEVEAVSIIPANDRPLRDEAPVNDSNPSLDEKPLDNDMPANDSTTPDAGTAACDSAVSVDSEPIQEEQAPKINLNSANIPPLIRRAFIFIEDSEWERADRYLENALDQEPENAFAYLGKLLVNLKRNDISALYEHKASLGTNPYYKRALQFADPELKAELQKIVS